MIDPTVDAERRATEVIAREYLYCGPTKWENLSSGLRAHLMTEAAELAAMLAQAGVLADAQHDAQVAAKALRDAADEIGRDVSPNFGMRHDGTVDPSAEAYVEGLHDAHAIVMARAERTGQA